MAKRPSTPPLLAALGLLVFVGGSWVLGVNPFATPAKPPAPAGAPGPASPAAPGDAKPAGRSTAQAPAPSAASKTIRIGTWNIEWLGRPDERSGAAQNIPQSADDLADYLVAADVQAVALQEVVATGRGKLRSAELDRTFETVKARTGQVWDYVLFPGRNEGAQLTGAAWNTAVLSPQTAEGRPFDPRKDEPWPVPIARRRGAGGAGLWSRPPYALKLTTGQGTTDFVLLVVHMKADFQGDFSAQRADEAGVLAEAIPITKRTFRDDDILILGDTNVTQPAEQALAVYTGAGFLDLNARNLQTHWRGGATDRIFVPPDQPEFSARFFEVESDTYLRRHNWQPRDYKRRISDHYMVLTSLRVMPDDD
ncbi:MAG: endonuclease/exonuclease/phosphatase family protein [Phycisphaerales bacterium]|nr:endonuclease/exonuclease/phosphatase family protein [Phycisphaerales bacterium]